jgi:DNA polymerase-1
LAADYSQIELRIIAEISNDKSMLEAFVAGNDFTRATAAKVYGVPYDEVTSEQSRNAKTVNFPSPMVQEQPILSGSWYIPKGSNRVDTKLFQRVQWTKKLYG